MSTEMCICISCESSISTSMLWVAIRGKHVSKILPDNSKYYYYYFFFLVQKSLKTNKSRRREKNILFVKAQKGINNVLMYKGSERQI